MCAPIRNRPSYLWLRRPETGLVMVRARAGGSGAQFNLGEMAVTRCVLRTANDIAGYAYVPGRNSGHAELAALMDAMLLDPARHDEVYRCVVRPLVESRRQRLAATAAKAAATKVEFFTLVRGEND